jgi:hypothetical protein
MPGFSVCVLLYGDYPDLAERCLGSIVRSADWELIRDVRIGCNEISSRTSSYLASILPQIPGTCYLYSEVNGKNVGKYPMMRRMFYSEHAGSIMQSDRVMWFDDDSFVRDKAGPAWWTSVVDSVIGCGLLGAVYRMPFIGQQKEAIEAQPWYTGERWRQDQGDIISFVQGGWWVVRPQILQRWDYPFPALHHNGGDTMLGELCHQQHHRVCRFNEGIAINAGSDGKESCATRRGISTSRLWEKYDPLVPDRFEHQQFALLIKTYMDGKIVGGSSGNRDLGERR